MTNVRVTLLALAAFALAFLIALAAYFPGESLARYLSLQAERSLGMPVKVSPIRLGLTGLGADSVEVRPTEGTPVVFRSVRAPWTWRWFVEFPLAAHVGADGSLRMDWGWSGDLALTAKGIALQDIPVALLPRDARIQGKLDISVQTGPIALKQSGLREIPQGQLDMKLENFEVSHLKVAGISVPAVHLDGAEARVVLGRTLQVENATFQGDVQGTITGAIVPNLERPGDSRVSLNVSLQVQRAWLDRLGDLRPIAEGYLPGGRFEGVVEGTISAPVLNRNAKRS